MLTVLHSSAGAGKTHALVKHYLSLCLMGRTNAYAQVLALTFTNKAAQEMQDRVLEYLHALAHDDTSTPAMVDVQGYLIELHGIPAVELRKRANDTLGHMLHHWSDVAITTIDAFTRRMLLPFTRDLQMDQDLAMTTEQDHYLGMAVEGLMERVGTDPAITLILRETCAQLLDEEQTWRPDRPLLHLAKELLKESSIKPLARLEGISPKALAELRQRLAATVSAHKEKVRTMAADALRILDEAGLTEKDLARGKSGIRNYFARLMSDPGLMPPPNSYVLGMMDGGKWHSAKAGPGTIAAIAAVRPALMEIYSDLERVRLEEYADFLLRQAVLRDLMPTAALHELDIELQRMKDQDAVAFFNDLTRKVALIVQQEPVPFIHERLGERYRHFLIDEFQDTSLLQWHSLIPLVDNALASGGSAMLVGDAKQAIYRWRNGEVRQFVELPAIHAAEDLADGAQRENNFKAHFRKGTPLDANYRSGTAIVGFNDRLFGRLASTLPEELQAVYAGHGQKAACSHEGFLRMDLVEDRLTGDDGREMVQAFVLDHITEVLEHGYRYGDIAVLVRTGAQGREVAEMLTREGVPVISSDALQLGSDRAVRFAIAMLRFIHLGTHEAAAQALQLKALLETGNDGTIDPFHDRPSGKEAVKALREWSSGCKGIRFSAPVTELIDKLLLAVGVDAATDGHCSALLDTAFAHGLAHGPDIGGFLEFWDRSGADTAIAPAEGADAVRIMTIHASKGLQFPVVIVPHTSTRSRPGGLLWTDPGKVIPELPAALVRDSTALRESGVPELIEEEQLRALDELNLLYVAFTRPKDRLYALVKRSGTGLAGSLWEELQDLRTDDVVRLGTPALKEGGQAPPAQQAPAPYARTSGGSSPLFRLEAPQDEASGRVDPLRLHGTIVHGILARIQVAADVEPALAMAVHNGELTEQEARELAEQLDMLLASDALGRFYAKDVKGYNEAALITAEGSVVRPDRVVLDGDKVRVLDLKTGAPATEHHAQVASYIRHLRSMGHADVEGALLYLRSGTVEPVHA